MKKIDQLINRDIHERLYNLDDLTQKIASFFSIPVENRFWPIIKNQQLILMTDDPHLATQARFKQRYLCTYLSKSLKSKINRVDIKVINLPLASFEQKTDRFRISGEAADIVSSIALSIEDQDLQQSLSQLVGNIKRHNQA